MRDRRCEHNDMALNRLKKTGNASTTGIGKEGVYVCMREREREPSVNKPRSYPLDWKLESTREPTFGDACITKGQEFMTNVRLLQNNRSSFPAVTPTLATLCELPKELAGFANLALASGGVLMCRGRVLECEMG